MHSNPNPTTAPAEPDTTPDLTAAVGLLRRLIAAGWKVDYAYPYTEDGSGCRGLVHPSGQEVQVRTYRDRRVGLTLSELTLGEAVGAVAGAGLAPEPTAEDEPDPRRTFYNLVAAGVAAGLPIPVAVDIPDTYRIFEVRLADNDQAAADAWAAHLNLPTPALGSVVHGGTSSFRVYGAETWQHPAMPEWTIEVSSRVDEPFGGESR